MWIKSVECRCVECLWTRSSIDVWHSVFSYTFNDIVSVFVCYLFIYIQVGCLRSMLHAHWYEEIRINYRSYSLLRQFTHTNTHAISRTLTWIRIRRRHRRHAFSRKLVSPWHEARVVHICLMRFHLLCFLRSYFLRSDLRFCCFFCVALWAVYVDDNENNTYHQKQNMQLIRERYHTRTAVVCVYSLFVLEEHKN